MVERFNGRIEDVLQSHHFGSGEDLEQTLLRYVHLYNSQLPQSALKGRTPIAALKDWQRQKRELFRKRVYNHTGCDSYVDQWRALPNPGDWAVTPETARLLQHWRYHKFEGIRPFFCQIEAVETAIWLTEVAPKLGQRAAKFWQHITVDETHHHFVSGKETPWVSGGTRLG